MNSEENSIEMVKDYYGRILASSADLKTSACCLVERLPPSIAEIVSQIHPEVLEKFYGCGVIAPAAIQGKTILDLGCGSGRDVYVLSRLVGETGRVIGVDMTDEQLSVAKRHQAYHAAAFGYKQSNVSFRKGYIEDLRSLDIADASVDLVVSNCVINLSPSKDKVFSEIFRVLKPGGELHFSDVFADRRLPPSFAEDQILLGECLGGAMYREDFRRTMQAVGCQDVRTLASAPIAITNDEVARKTGLVQFTSYTFRAFKLPLEDRCEDHGQIATYKGTIEGSPHAYRLDDHHLFEAHRPMLVCGNTAQMLSDTRFAEHFAVSGDRRQHFGLFDCSVAPASAPTAAGACC